MYIDPSITKGLFEPSNLMKSYDDMWKNPYSDRFFKIDPLKSTAFDSDINDCIRVLNSIYENTKHVPDEESQEFINKFVESCRKGLNTKNNNHFFLNMGRRKGYSYYIANNAKLKDIVIVKNEDQARILKRLGLLGITIFTPLTFDKHIRGRSSELTGRTVWIDNFSTICSEDLNKIYNLIPVSLPKDTIIIGLG